MTTDRWPKRASLEVALSGGHGAPLRAGEGRGDDLAVASRRCSASSRPTRAIDAATLDRLLRRGGRALVRAHLRRRPALDQRLGVLHRGRRVGRRGRARAATTSAPSRAALDALLRQLAIEIVADGEGADAGRAAGGARLGRGGRAGRARGRQLAAREVRAARRRPELGPDPRGGRPGAAGRRPGRARPLRSRRCRSRARAARSTLDDGERRRLDEAMRSREVEMRLELADGGRGGARSSSATSATSTCAQLGVLDVSDDRRDPQPRDRDAARVAPLHPGVLRHDDRDQVRRRGDGARRTLREAFATDVVLLKYVGHEPGDRPRRRPGDHRATCSGSGSRSSSSRACACPTSRRSRSRRWCWSASSTRTSCCGSTGTARPPSGCAGTTARCSRSRKQLGPGRRRRGARPRLRRRRSSASTSTC